MTKRMMKFDDLLRGINCVSKSGNLQKMVTGVAYDSRMVRSGNVFVALRGCKADGRDFAAEALRRGASALILEEGAGRVDGEELVPRVRVHDARLAMGIASSLFYGNPSEKLYLAGITGTNGKTTTAYMIREIFESAGRASGLLSTVEYLIGDRAIPAVRTTSEAPDLQSMFHQMLETGCDSAVMEVSSHALVQKRTVGTEYDVAVFTNLSRDHLDYHETMDDYFDAKSVLFSELGKGCKKDAVAVINADDPWGQKLIESRSISTDIISYGFSGDADVRAENLTLSANGTGYDVLSPWGKAEQKLNLLGRFNVSNALAAVAACGAAGIDLEASVSMLSKMTSVSGRLQEVETSGGFKVFVDYAHTDDALEKVLTSLREITDGRLISVFGCGGDRDRSKRPAMGAVSGQLADYTIITSDNPRSEEPSSIISEITAGFNGDADYEVVENRRDAIKRSIELAQKGDIVLVAGKGHENFQQLQNTVVPFDDRQVVREEIERVSNV